MKMTQHGQASQSHATALTYVTSFLLRHAIQLNVSGGPGKSVIHGSRNWLFYMKFIHLNDLEMS